MRVNLTAQTSILGRDSSTEGAVLLTVRPCTKIPGDFSYTTSGRSLFRLLRNNTDLQASIIEKFAQDLVVTKTAKLIGVEVNDRALTEIGYLID